MLWLRTHLISACVVALSVTACGAFVAYTHSPPGVGGDTREKVVDISKGPALTATQVARIFAAHGIPLTPASGHVTGATSFTDVHPNPAVDDGLLVTIWDPALSKVHVSVAATKPRFEQWVGNVDVYYGGLGNTLAAKVAAAAAALAR